jgi:hypothetical protein
MQFAINKANAGYAVLLFLVILTIINFVQYLVVYNNLDQFKTDKLKVSLQHAYENNTRVYDYWKNMGGDRVPALKSMVALAAVLAPFVGALAVTYGVFDYLQPDLLQQASTYVTY